MKNKILCRLLALAVFLQASGLRAQDTSQVAAGVEAQAADESLDDESASEAVTEERPLTRRERKLAKREARRRSNGKGAKIAGFILGGVGAVGLGGGLLMMMDGQNNIDSALARNNGIDKGLGETEKGTGAFLSVIGGAMLVAGIVVGTIGFIKAGRAQRSSLINVEDGKVAWDLPAVDFHPATQQSRITLLTAQF